VPNQSARCNNRDHACFIELRSAIIRTFLFCEFFRIAVEGAGKERARQQILIFKEFPQRQRLRLVKETARIFQPA
jgi:hypothetical protein